MQEERDFVVVRSDLIGCWLRLAPSANSTPPSVRHAFRRKASDAVGKGGGKGGAKGGRLTKQSGKGTTSSVCPMGITDLEGLE